MRTKERNPPSDSTPGKPVQLRLLGGCIKLSAVHLRRRRGAGRASAIDAPSGGLVSLLGNLFSFLLFFYPLLLDPVLRHSFLELDAVAPCALKRLEWSSHLYSGISTAETTLGSGDRVQAARMRRGGLTRTERCHVRRP